MECSKDDIKRIFSAKQFTPPEEAVLIKCALLAQKHNLTAEDVVNEMDAFSLSIDDGMISPAHLGKFEHYLKDQQAKIIAQRNAERAKADAMKTTPDRYGGKRPSTQFNTPSQMKAPRATPDSQPSGSPDLTPGGSLSASTPTVFADREKKFSVILQRNEGLATRPPPKLQGDSGTQPEFCCTIRQDNADFENIRDRYRFMYTSLDERARAMEKHLNRIQDKLCELACLNPSELSPVGLPSQETVWVCGRVCAEASSSGASRLNHSSVLLEGSRRESGGRRVLLDLDQIGSYSLFPGQIVLVQGVNSTGRKMSATRLVSTSPNKLPRSKPSEIMEFNHSEKGLGGQPLSLCVAAGPFTTSDNLLYEPLNELFRWVFTKQPDVLILVGPFVDISHPIVSSGDIEVMPDEGRSFNASFEMLFIRKIITDGIAALFESGEIRTQIVLVPSLLDAHHEYVFPQPPFGDRDPIDVSFLDAPLGTLNIPREKEQRGELFRKQVHLMSNPCMFRINEVLVGVTSQDILMTMSAEEISRSPQEANKTSRLLSHMLHQQSFFPLLPPPAAMGAQLDMRQHKHWTMNVSPDILIVPSKMPPLVNDVSGTLVLNPGLLGKMKTTFCDITIHPMDAEVLRMGRIEKGDAEIEHCIPGRTRVDFIKI